MCVHAWMTLYLVAGDTTTMETLSPGEPCEQSRSMHTETEQFPRNVGTFLRREQSSPFVQRTKRGCRLQGQV
jgi:hypothetical protein